MSCRTTTGMSVASAARNYTYMPLGVITVSKSLVRLPWAASGRDISADIIAVAPRLNPRQLFGQDSVGREGSPPSTLSLHVSPDQWSREDVSSELSAPSRHVVSISSSATTQALA
jgi:hypothetical protein